MFNKQWIKKSYDIIYTNEKLIEIIPSRIEEEPIFEQIRRLYNIYYKPEKVPDESKIIS
jgi:hypothetical protein